MDHMTRGQRMNLRLDLRPPCSQRGLVRRPRRVRRAAPPARCTRRRRADALARTHGQARVARGGQHRDPRHHQGEAGPAQSAARRSLLPPLLRRAAGFEAARAAIPERRLRRDRRRQERLHHHQSPRGRERQRNHRDAARQPQFLGQGHRFRRGRGHRRAAGEAAESRRHGARRFLASSRWAITWSPSAIPSVCSTP